VVLGLQLQILERSRGHVVLPVAEGVEAGAVVAAEANTRKPFLGEVLDQLLARRDLEVRSLDLDTRRARAAAPPLAALAVGAIEVVVA
jgi:hypothetical protein